MAFQFVILQCFAYLKDRLQLLLKQLIYPDVTNTVNVMTPSGSVVYGSLKLLPANSNLLNGANESMILTLVSSSMLIHLWLIWLQHRVEL